MCAAAWSNTAVQLMCTVPLIVLGLGLAITVVVSLVTLGMGLAYRSWDCLRGSGWGRCVVCEQVA